MFKMLHIIPVLRFQNTTLFANFFYLFVFVIFFVGVIITGVHFLWMCVQICVYEGAYVRVPVCACACICRHDIYFAHWQAVCLLATVSSPWQAASFVHTRPLSWQGSLSFASCFFSFFFFLFLSFRLLCFSIWYRSIGVVYVLINVAAIVFVSS